MATRLDSIRNQLSSHYSSSRLTPRKRSPSPSSQIDQARRRNTDQPSSSVGLPSPKRSRTFSYSLSETALQRTDRPCTKPECPTLPDHLQYAITAKPALWCQYEPTAPNHEAQVRGQHVVGPPTPNNPRTLRDRRVPAPGDFALESGPKRKQAAFVKEEELNCMLEDRAGTPHLSELQHDEDITATLNMEELGLAGQGDLFLAGDVYMSEQGA